jgi:hypothetical protein
MTTAPRPDGKLTPPQRRLVLLAGALAVAAYTLPQLVFGIGA